MSAFSFITCALGLHRPVRRDVTWNGLIYVSHCRHCGAPIERHGRRKWRRTKEPAGQRDLPTPT